MIDYNLKLESVTKIFGRRLIFKNINYSFHSGKVYGLAGNNGSGKSTLTKILGDIISSTRGKVTHFENKKQIISEKLHNKIGFVSPYLVLYEEFSAEENLLHFSKIRGIKFDIERISYLLNEFNLYNRKNDLLKTYSSGMKQRMKFIFALQHDPPLLLFDEPTSNLDNSGKDKVYKLIENESKEKLVVIASNDDNDLAVCSEILRIEEYKNNSIK